MAVGTIAKKVPQTINEADRIVARIRKRRAENAADKSRCKELNAELKVLNAKMSKRDEENEADQELVQAFADAHRNELTDDGETKSFRFPSGAVGQWGFPSSAKLIVAGTLEAIVKVLMKLPNWAKYVEVKLKKNNIKADLDELHQKNRSLRSMLRLEKKERFWVKT